MSQARHHDGPRQLDEERAQLGGEDAEDVDGRVVAGPAPCLGQTIGVIHAVADDDDRLGSGDAGPRLLEGATQESGGGGGSENVGQVFPQQIEEGRRRGAGLGVIGQWRLRASSPTASANSTGSMGLERWAWKPASNASLTSSTPA